MTAPPRTSGRAIAGLVLFLLVLAAFWPVLGHGFVDYDDEKYVTGNRHVQTGFHAESLRWAWTSFHAANWHPLTWMSHMLDWRFFGAAPMGHHLTSLLLHAANTVLLFLLLTRMTTAPMQSALVAVLFGLHPLHVESVAWVAERKDVLSTLFWLLMIGAYLGYVRRPGVGRYLLVALALALGLSAKPMLVTAPLTLLLLDFWPLGRFADRASSGRSAARLIVEKLPLLALVAASAVVTLFAQRAGGAVASLQSFPPAIRAANAVVSYATYLWRTLWPAGLALPYPHPGAELSGWAIAGSLATLTLITVVAVRSRARHPFLLCGWVWYLVTLLPVIGLIQVGRQAMADRYTYVPLIGVFIMIAWGIPAATGPITANRKDPSPDNVPVVRRDTGLLALLFLVVPLLIVGTRFQVRHWRDGETLARRALAVTENNSVAHNQLALALVRRGQASQALPHYLEAIDISPGFAEAFNNLGGALVELGRDEEAIERYREALALHPAYPEARNNLGVALAGRQRVEEALEQFSRAVQLRADYGKAHANLAMAHFTLENYDAAWREVELARRSGFEPPAALVQSIKSMMPGTD